MLILKLRIYALSSIRYPGIIFIANLYQICCHEVWSTKLGTSISATSSSAGRSAAVDKREAVFQIFQPIVYLFIICYFVCLFPPTAGRSEDSFTFFGRQGTDRDPKMLSPSNYVTFHRSAFISKASL